MTWTTDAACRDMDWKPFVVPNGTDRDKPTKANLKAIAICERCTVRRECLDDANRLRDSYTIRAGLLPRHPDRETHHRTRGLCLEGVDVETASDLIGIRRSAIHARIHKGTLDAHKVVEEGNVRWCVHLGDDDDE